MGRKFYTKLTDDELAYVTQLESQIHQIKADLETAKLLLSQRFPERPRQWRYPENDTFDLAWVVLSRQSKCDEIGGAEYTRCKKVWEAAGLMRAAFDFIAEQANLSPTPIPEVR